MIAPGMGEVLLPLNLLKPSEAAQIAELQGDADQVHRLAEMGLRVGQAIRMVRPGTPCLIALDGKRLSIRLSGDVEVFVSLVEG
jgi:ferrous iron transport protein A